MVVKEDPHPQENTDGLLGLSGASPHNKTEVAVRDGGGGHASPAHIL